MHNHTWIEDVIQDIECYATEQGLTKVKKALESVQSVLREEIANHAAKELVGHKSSSIIPFPCSVFKRAPSVKRKGAVSR